MFFNKKNSTNKKDETLITQLSDDIKTLLKFLYSNDILQNPKTFDSSICFIQQNSIKLIIDIQNKLNQIETIRENINIEPFNNYISQILNKINSNTFTKQDLKNLIKLFLEIEQIIEKNLPKKTFFSKANIKKATLTAIATALLSIPIFTKNINIENNNQINSQIITQTITKKTTEKNLQASNQSIQQIQTNSNQTHINYNQQNNTKQENLNLFNILKIQISKNQIENLKDKITTLSAKKYVKEILKIYKNKTFFDNNNLNYLLELRIINENFNEFKNIFNGQNKKDIIYLSNLILNKIKIIYVKYRIKEYVQNKHYTYSNIEQHIRESKIQNQKSQINQVIFFSNINPNLSYNTYILCKKYKLNLKLMHSILLIENNFGNTKTSFSGAKGISQVKDEIREKYFKNDTSQWAYFVSSFLYLKDEGVKKLELKIDNIYGQVPKEDFVLAMLLYHEGMNRLLNHIDDILNKNPKYIEGLDYINKAINLYDNYKFNITISVLKNNGSIIPNQTKII